MNQNLKEAIEQLARIQGAKFISLTYRAKGTGELARHTLLLGVNLQRAYTRDLAFYRSKLGWITRGLLRAQGDVKATLLTQQVACQELIASLVESLKVGIGNNSAYTCKDVYANLTHGVKYHVDNKELHLNAFSRAKVVLEAGIYKDVKSSPKTIAKNALRKIAKLGRFRQFVLSENNIQSIRVNGNILEIASV